MVGRWTFLLGLGLFSGAFANTLCQLSQTFLHWTYRTDTHESREKNYATDLKQKELFIVEIPDTSHKFSEELGVFVTVFSITIRDFWRENTVFGVKLLDAWKKGQFIQHKNHCWSFFPGSFEDWNPQALSLYSPWKSQIGL